MAAAAIYQGMLSFQVKPSGLVREGHVLAKGLPARGGVTIGTIDGKLLPMRRLARQVKGQKEQPSYL